MKNILITGDSLSYGHGCSDRLYYYDPELKKQVGDSNILNGPPSENCWGSLLKRDLGTNVTNVSRPGSSNHGSYLRAMNIIESSYDLVIFIGTWNDRVELNSYKGNKTRTQILTCVEHDIKQHLRINPIYATAIELYFKYLYNEEITRHVNSQSILSLYSYCLLNDVEFLYTFPENDIIVPKIENLFVKHRINSIQSELISQCHNKNAEQKNIKLPDGHFNDAGHKLFYENYIKEKVTKLLDL